jgi:hypothetical protein
MNTKNLIRISSYQQTPETVFSCCKKFTIERVYNFRWKNRFYYIDNHIKVISINNDHLLSFCIKKRIMNMYKKGINHCDIINPKTGLTLPAKVWYHEKEVWYKNGEIHRTDIDPNYGLTLPAFIENDKKRGKEKEEWYKNGVKHRNDIDQKTGLSLPAHILDEETEIWNIWYNYDVNKRDDIDPETGLTFPTFILNDKREEWKKYREREEWNKNGKLHRDDIHPDTGFTLPARITKTNRGFKVFYWHKNGFFYRDDIDPKTGSVLPSVMDIHGRKTWHSKSGYSYIPKFIKFIRKNKK